MEIVTAPHLAVRNEWLALHREAPLQPELPIIDAHHHLWDRQTGRYLTHEFSDDIQTSGHRVVSSVYVQCRSMLRRDGPETLKPLGEIEFASGIAAMFASGHYANALGCEAIIGGLSLLAGDAMQPAIERAIALSGGRLRGMRNPLAWHPDPRVTSSPVTPLAGLAQSAPFRRGAACLARHALSLDVWVYHTQLEEIADLAREIPTLQIVIDHCGGPVGVGPCSERDPDMFQQWRNGMRRLAELPNVCVKISGFGMTVRGFTSQRQRRRRIRKCWHRHGCRGLRPLFLFSVPNAACSPATFPSIKACSATAFSGTPANAWRNRRPLTNRRSCSGVPPQPVIG